jgi:hypothetical protein
MNNKIAPLSIPTKSEFQTTTLGSEKTGEAHTNQTSLLKRPPPAKPIPSPDRDLQKLADVVMARAPCHGSLKSALKRYLLSSLPLAAIANEQLCTVSGLVYWIRKLELPRRRRGRRLLLKPTVEHERVLALVREYGAVEAARRAVVSRQRVYQILSRWAPEWKRHWIPRKPTRRPRRRRHALPTVVVSFRITVSEWELLLATQPPSGQFNLSGFAKARWIVRDFLASGGDNGLVPVTNPSFRRSGTGHSER